MNGSLFPPGKITVPGQDREIPLSPGEVLIGMAMQELLGEVVTLRRAVEALIEEPGNPFAGAEKARAIFLDSE